MASSQETRDAIQFWLLVFGAVAVCVFAGRSIAQSPPFYVLAGAVGAVVGLTAFLSPKWGLALVIFSMIFSPKVEGMSIADNVGTHGSVIFKLNDILLFVILFAWMGRTAIFKGKAFLVKTPLNLPILCMGSMFLICTLLGIIRGNLRGVTRPLFYVLKYVEYYLLFFMTVNVVDSREDARRCLKYGWITAILVTIVGYSQVASGERVSAPFDTPINSTEVKANEANTFGGYYLVIFGLLLGFYTQTLGLPSTIAAGSFLAMMTPFLLTQSRSSYGGFAAALIFHLLATRKRQLAVLFGLGVAVFIVLLTPRLRDTVTQRVQYTFSGYSGGQVAIAGANIALEGSAYARVESWQFIFRDCLPVHPVLGFGVTGVGLVDAYYPRLIGETGLVGLVCFLWLASRIWACAWRLFKLSSRAEDQALSLGLLTALVGLLVHGVAANTFLIVRIMEPFWFATALMARIYVDEVSSRNPAERFA